MTEKISTKEIAELVAQKSGATLAEIESFLDNFQEIFTQAIDKDKVLKISGLGTFKLIWNKPRKSVDVNTGEEIEIAGHYRLGFNSDSYLNELLNSDEKIDLSKENLPLKKLAKQALEIKTILADIQEVEAQDASIKYQDTSIKTQDMSIKTQDMSMNVKTQENELPVVEKINENQKKEAEQKIVEQIKEKNQIEEKIEIKEEKKPVEEKIEIKEEEKPVEEKIEIKAEEKPVEENIEPMSEEKKELDEKEIAQRKSATEFFGQKLQQPYEVKANTFTYIPYDEKLDNKKSKWWLWLLIAILLVGGVAAYFYFQPQHFENVKNFGINVFEKGKTLFEKKEKPTEILPDTTTFTDTLKIEQDTLKIDTLIFQQPRTYTEFITQDKVEQGTTLVKLSEKHYGKKDFWVYIYEANKGALTKPNDLKPGQTVKIPKLDARLINANDTLCLKYAKELHDKYVGK
ncbi:MAG: HU family DNA-binding protein [Prevotellaceae bacterium]|jgi:nucleoid DNA-binding protein/nucleoid-associated protein YgaU|nr:HU family DNA-binding protein [Prevotellaceae bacterium]